MTSGAPPQQQSFGAYALPQSPVKNAKILSWQPDETSIPNEIPVLKINDLCHLEEVANPLPRASSRAESDDAISYLEAMKSLATAALLPKAELMNFDGNPLN